MRVDIYSELARMTVLRGFPDKGAARVLICRSFICSVRIAFI